MTDIYSQEFKVLSAQQPRDRRQLTRKFAQNIKTNAVCFDCKENFPHYILQFDHVRGEKIADVNTLARQGDMQLLLDEISKCEIVCANCHMHRTWVRSVSK